MARGRSEWFDQSIPPRNTPQKTSSPVITGLIAQAARTMPPPHFPPCVEGELIDYAVAQADVWSGEIEQLHIRDRYLAMSVLQKAIRLGNSAVAMSAVKMLVDAGAASTAWRRLRVIAVEDIGLGDPAAAALVLWLASARGLHARVGDIPLASVAVDHLCAATKSRDMADTIYWQNLPGSIDDDLARSVILPTPDLLDVAADTQATFRQRLAAVRAFFPYKFRGHANWRRRPLEDRHALYRRLDVRPDVAFIVERDVQFGGDALTCVGPLIDVLVRSSPCSGAITDPMDLGEPSLIGGMYASVFDRHLYAGKAAISELRTRHQPLADFFCRNPDASEMDCMMRAVFYAEGAVLRPKLAYQAADDLYWSVLQDKFASGGLRLHPEGLELLDLTRAALPVLNDIRRRRFFGV